MRFFKDMSNQTAIQPDHIPQVSMYFIIRI